VALVTAATVIAAIGDFRRFTHSKAIAVTRDSIAGLRLGGKQRIGHIAKTGSARSALILQQAAWTCHPHR